MQRDYTDDEAIDARNDKTGPHLSSDQDRRNDGEKTRKVIQPEHRHGAPLIFIATRHVLRNLRARGVARLREKGLVTDDK